MDYEPIVLEGVTGRVVIENNLFEGMSCPVVVSRRADPKVELFFRRNYVRKPVASVVEIPPMGKVSITDNVVTDIPVGINAVSFEDEDVPLTEEWKSSSYIFKRNRILPLKKTVGK